ncbi:hypothetical protein PG996_006686 [Apiospora saccharicola]|uniref:Uncharacterized protein n=1 Tax=Apiospora saccharicola TaxID=335842 RepID=A0ABR1V8P1_9PEZI
MHSLSLPLALLVGFGMAAALPATTETNPEPLSLVVTFKGAGEGSYYRKTVVANGFDMSIEYELSVSYISVEKQAGYFCTSRSKDGSETSVYADKQDVPVGPPQTQNSVRCSRL